MLLHANARWIHSLLHETVVAVVAVLTLAGET